MANEPFTLIVGTKTWSSWSLRAWLMLKKCRVPFTEIVVPLRRDDTAARLAELSPSGKVPVLRHGDRVVWDTLAIAEYLADEFPRRALWPRDPAARALARSISAEMHSGFTAMRESMPMDFLARHEGGAEPGPATQRDIDRIQAVWRQARDTFGAAGPYLFGAWTLADAMYAPVASRFVTYGVSLEPDSADYVETLIGDAAMKEWRTACEAAG